MAKHATRQFYKRVGGKEQKDRDINVPGQFRFNWLIFFSSCKWMKEALATRQFCSDGALFWGKWSRRHQHYTNWDTSNVQQSSVTRMASFVLLTRHLLSFITNNIVLFCHLLELFLIWCATNHRKTRSKFFFSFYFSLFSRFDCFSTWLPMACRLSIWLAGVLLGSSINSSLIYGEPKRQTSLLAINKGWNSKLNTTLISAPIGSYVRGDCSLKRFP